MRNTHTLATMKVSQSAYDEVAKAFRAAGYDHVFLDDNMIDMTGIALIPPTGQHHPVVATSPAQPEEQDPLPCVCGGKPTLYNFSRPPGMVLCRYFCCDSCRRTGPQMPLSKPQGAVEGWNSMMRDLGVKPAPRELTIDWSKLGT